MTEKRKRGRPKMAEEDKVKRKYSKEDTKYWLKGLRQSYYKDVDKTDETDNSTNSRFLDLN